jgi:hypothetical protein
VTVDGRKNLNGVRKGGICVIVGLVNVGRVDLGVYFGVEDLLGSEIIESIEWGKFRIYWFSYWVVKREVISEGWVGWVCIEIMII